MNLLVASALWPIFKGTCITEFTLSKERSSYPLRGNAPRLARPCCKASDPGCSSEHQHSNSVRGIRLFPSNLSVWVKDYFSISFCLLTPRFSLKLGNCGWVCIVFVVSLSLHLPICSLQTQLQCLSDWRKSKNAFIFAEVLLYTHSLSYKYSQYGSAA